jgi:hypothetical protein
VAWERYQSARAAESTVRGWWRRWPEANVGVVTGAVSDLVVLDVDPRHGGDERLTRLEDDHGDLPPTPEVVTGGSGRHLYFAHPGRTVATGPLTDGLDLKGDGGLVVAPPSVHHSGAAYRWQSGRGPDDLPRAPLPRWLPDLTHGATPPGRRAGSVAPLARSAADQAEFARLWAEVGVSLEPGDRNYLCPFHDDHHPSLHVDAEGCRWYCFACAVGGGLGRLRREVGRHDGRPVPPPDLPAVSLAAEATELVEVVGESIHQRDLETLAGGRRQRSARVDTVAGLEPERGVAAGTVDVTIRSCPVGHLTQADGDRYRRLVEMTIRTHGEATCPAQIRGGWSRTHGDCGRFGVVLWLPRETA